MDNKDGRRSRVPAGTFGGSGAPPPPANRPPATPPPPPPEARARQAKTLTGEDGPVPAPPPPEDATEAGADAAAEARRRHVSTLVGVPAIAARSSAPQSNAPMVAPPPWRGAQPYLSGEEPQLRISSMPAPKHVPAAPSATGEPSRSRVTTKMAAVPPVPAQPLEGERGASPPLGDTIQEMLDAQASVPMQVDEPQAESRSSEETPIDEVPIDEILDSLSEPPPPSEAGESRKRHDEPTLVHAAPPPADGPRVSPEPALAAVERPSEPELIPEPELEPAPVVIDPLPVLAKAEKKKPEAEAAAQARPAPPPPPPAALERARRTVSTASTTPAEAVTSLAPAEVARRSPRYRDDAQAGLGIVLVAAMAVIGVGGWFLTRGGYPGVRQRHEAQATTSALPSPPPATVLSPAAPAVAMPAEPSAAAAATGAAAPEATSAAAKNAKKPAAVPAPAPAPARVATPTKPASKDDESAPAPAPSEAQVLKVTPRSEAPGEMSDIPSRDDVLAALAPIRAAVSECAAGQRGVAQLDITVANTGFVTHAVVGGDFAGTPEGSCIARVARSAQFVPFKKPRFRVIYPFSL